MLIALITKVLQKNSLKLGLYFTSGPGLYLALQSPGHMHEASTYQWKMSNRNSSQFYENQKSQGTVELLHSSFLKYLHMEASFIDQEKDGYFHVCPCVKFCEIYIYKHCSSQVINSRILHDLPSNSMLRLKSIDGPFQVMGYIA